MVSTDHCYIDLSLNVNMQVPESDFRDEGLGDIIDQLKGVGNFGI
jgi:hypothetical protein